MPRCVLIKLVMYFSTGIVTATWMNYPLKCLWSLKIVQFLTEKHILSTNEIIRFFHMQGLTSTFAAAVTPVFQRHIVLTNLILLY